MERLRTLIWLLVGLIVIAGLVYTSEVTVSGMETKIGVLENEVMALKCPVVFDEAQHWPK